MNFTERVEVHGRKDGIYTHLGNQRVDPFLVLIDEIVCLAKNYGAEDCFDDTVREGVADVVRHFKTELSKTHGLTIKNDFQPA